MTGSERREYIVRRIKDSNVRVSGTTLARECQVSRQVIVQDIALIRAAGYDILSTNRGYILQQPKTVSRVFTVQIENEEKLDQIEDMLRENGLLVEC